MKIKVLSVLLSAVLLLGIAPVRVRAASDMKASQAFVDVLKQWEGFSPVPYRDKTQYTMGYGTKCPDDMVDYYTQNPLTREQAEVFLWEYVDRYSAEVNAFIDRHGLSYSQGQFDAVLSLVYNIGPNWLRNGQTLIAALTGGDMGNELIYALTIYSTSGGGRSIPHVKRRLAEANMYINGEYGRTPPEHYSYVLFDPCGGKISAMGDKYNVQGYDALLTAQIVATAYRDGFVFKGWFTARTGGTQVTVLDESTKTMTLYAQWEEVSNPATDPAEPTTAPTLPMPTEPATEPAQPAVKPTTAPTTAPTTKPTTAPTTKPTTAPTTKPTNAHTIKPTQAPQPTQPPFPTGEPITPTVVKVTGDYVNVRKGPGTGYGAVTMVEAGDQLQISALYRQSGRLWGKFELGWICLEYTNYGKTDIETTPTEPEQQTKPTEPVTVPTTVPITSPTKPSATQPVTSPTVSSTKPTEPAPTAKPTEPPATKPTMPEPTQPSTEPAEPVLPEPEQRLYARLVKTNTLIVREEPNGIAVGKLFYGDRVEILEQRQVMGNSWGRTDGGWISLSAYVALERDEQGPVLSTPGQADRLYATVIKTNTLNVRTRPNGDVLCQLYKNDRVEILEQIGINGSLWGRTDLGWISLECYVRLERAAQDGGSRHPEPDMNLIGTVDNTDTLIIRSQPGGVIVGKLYYGDRVEILERRSVAGRQWGRIHRGWICLENYVSLDPEPEVQGSVKLVAASCLNLRASAGTGGAVVGQLYRGMVIEIQEEKTVNGVRWGRIDEVWICLNYVMDR